MSQVLGELEKQIKNMDDKNKKHKNNITKLFEKDKDE